ncbi:MAG: complex I NDUFA9 subunit family protein, partial [Alphaproteobacteria bacterium]
MGVRRVTVFGGSGFIGRYVVERLANRGDLVVVAVRDPEGAKNLRVFGNVGQVTPVACNIVDPQSVAAIVAGSDCVVNLCGILSERGPQTFQSVHVDGAMTVARAAAAAGVKRLVQVSAIGASESSRSKYARSKAAGERAVRDAFPAATVLRPSVVFGPEDGFFNLFAGLARIAPALPLYGGGRTRFQPVYACDVAEAVVAALETDAAAGLTYELGGPEICTFRELMQKMLATIRRRRLLVSLPYFAGDVLGTLIDIKWAVLTALFGGMVPNPPLTRDMMRQLRADNVVGAGGKTLAVLGIAPTAMAPVL